MQCILLILKNNSFFSTMDINNLIVKVLNIYSSDLCVRQSKMTLTTYTYILE